MRDNDAARLINQLGRIGDALRAMNTNHAEIGKLFKAWTEVGEPEELEVEFEDREAFVIGQVVRCVDIMSVHYKHIGTITAIPSNAAHVEFQHLVAEGRGPVAMRPDQLEILPQPKLHIGDKVRVIDPHSMAYKEIGKLIDLVSGSRGVDVQFPSGSGGTFERRNLELVANAFATLFVMDTEGRLLPHQWRCNLGLSYDQENVPADAGHEHTLMTEEAFRIYNAGLIAKPEED